jgi:hypothetical protein
MTQLSALLSQIDSGAIVLPEFQRGYVWSRDQVRGLLRSLYLQYPVGGLLVWETQAGSSGMRNAEVDPSSVRTLLLDGQQRMTSLYGVVRGKPPEFFEGDPKSFLDLYFNVEDETFEFYAPVKMKDDARWINVTDLFQRGLEPYIATFNAPEYVDHFATYLGRLTRLQGILSREFHLEKIVGGDKTIDVVVDIFNRVNSGGTKLSKGDLALAKIAAAEPQTRQQMRSELARWQDAGYAFSLEWLLRNVTAVATGKALFSSLDTVSSSQFASAFKQTVGYLDTLLNLVADRLGLDHGRVLLSRYAFPVMVRYLHLCGGTFPSVRERDKLLYWYVHAGMWGRFSGSTETKLAQDYETLGSSGLDGIIATLAQTRGGALRVNAEDFTGFGMGSRFYPMLYLLTRVLGAKDFGTGMDLKATLLGRLSSLQVHHTFPKRVLYDADYTRGEVNAVANFVFLTQETNLAIGKTPPAEYMPKIAKSMPGVLESQWIPLDSELWTVDRYPDFLKVRRQLLAAAANGFLASLLDGSAASADSLPRSGVAEQLDDDPRTSQVADLLGELADHAVVAPLRDVQVSDPETGARLAVAEAFWPDGLQPGRGEPVVLELDPDDGDIERLQAIGYRVFTTLDSLRSFVLREAAEDSGELTPT